MFRTTGINRKYVFSLVGAVALLWGGGLQAQLYFPGGPEDNPPRVPNDFDPSNLNTFTEDSKVTAGNKVRRADGNCGGEQCTGILIHRLSNPRVEADVFKIDYEIKAGQAPGAVPASVNENSKPDNLGNVLADLVGYFHYGEAAFGSDRFDQTPDSTCTTDNQITGFSTRFTFTTTAPNGRNFNGSIMAFTYSNQFEANGPAGPTFIPNFQPYIIPHDRFDTAVTISCPIVSADAPANLAFHSQMFNLNSQLTGAAQKEAFASIADNNLWYYPLDGNPAIIDVEVGGGGDNFYVDVTFSEGVGASGGGAVGVDQFVMHLIPRTATSIEEGQSLDVQSVTRPGGAPVQVGDSVVRVKLENPTDTAAMITSDPNILVSTSPIGIVASDDGAALHEGPDWWVRAWYDHLAPYITTAEVGPGNAHVDITFSGGVKFEVSFDGENQAVMTGTRAPAPEDFEIWYYDRSEGSVEAFAPASVTDFNDDPITVAASAGVEQLRLEIPQEITGAYGPGDTIDIRTAQRQKNQLHPSLASVFVYGADNLSTPGNTAHAMHRKNSRFATAVGDTNFPRTAAFAQIGSLALKRTLAVTFELERLDLVIDGDEISVRVGLFGDAAELLAPGESLTVDVDWTGGAAPADVTLTNHTGISLNETNPVGTFTLQAGANATDGDMGTLEMTATYDGDAAEAGVTIASDDTLVVDVVQQVPVQVGFEDDSRARISSANARIGGEVTLRVFLEGSGLGALGSNQVSVMFAIEPSVPGVMVSPAMATFGSSGSTQTITIRAESDVMTRLSGVNLRTTVTPEQQTRLGAITPIPVGFTEGSLPIKVVPSFDFAPADGDMSADDIFAGLITSVAGSRPVLDGEYTIVPGTGDFTKLDLYAPAVNVVGNVHVCVKQVQEIAGKCMDAMNYTRLSADTDSATMSRTVEVAAFTSEVHWAAIDGTTIEPLGGGVKRVYVAPPVGFRTDALAYRSGSGGVNTGLSAATTITGAFVVTIQEQNATTGEVIATETATVTDPGPDTRYETPRSPKVLRIVALGGIAFSAGEYNPGSADIRTLINRNELLSIGNPSVTLIPIEEPAGLSFSGIEVFNQQSMVGNTLNVNLPGVLQDAALEVTITVYEFDPASLTFTREEFTSTATAQGGAGAVMLNNIAGLDLNSLSDNSFAEIRTVATAEGEEPIDSRFRFLVTSETAPADKTPVPGPYARAEIAAVSGQTAGDLSLQNDLGIQDVPGVGPVSEAPTGVFDYLVANLGDAEVVTIVLELEEAAGAGLVQHKYTEEGGWNEFVVTDFDRVYSAPAPCPSPSASREVAGDDSTSGNAWSLAHDGVSEGDGCILLQIREGGMNDADQTENGVLFDPTALAAAARVAAAGGGGGAIDPVWLILLAAGVLLSSAGSWRRRRSLA